MGRWTNRVLRSVSETGGAPRTDLMRRFELSLYKRSPELVLRALEMRAREAEVAASTVFLSHVEEDQALVRAAVNFIASHGILVHVDWVDGGVDDDSTGLRAESTRQGIERCRKFVFLATPEGLRSEWGAWGLGLADGVRGPDNVALLPVEEKATAFPESPHFALYPSIQRLEGEWMVIPPDGVVPMTVSDWLER